MIHIDFDTVHRLASAGSLVEPLRRAFASGVPYLLNVITDVDAEYPRTTTGV